MSLLGQIGRGVDRLVGVIAPQAAAKRAAYRSYIESGAAYSGASYVREAMRSWHASDGDANSDLIADLPTLRQRSRDLYRNNPIGRAAIDARCTNVVGPGLTLQCRIDHEFLGLDSDQADEWEADTERRFRKWAASPMCDAEQTLEFASQQALAYLTEKQGGECYTILKILPRGLALQTIEPDRVSTPDYLMDGPRLTGGIETDADGAPIAYHVRNYHPGNQFTIDLPKWVRVPARGSRSGRVNVIHVFKKTRPGQRHGEPYLAPVIETIKQLGRYTDAEVMAAVVNGLFTVIFKSQTLPDSLPGGTEKDAAPTGNLSMGYGSFVQAPEGMDVEFANPGRPNDSFTPFVQQVMAQVGMALGIPKEVLTKQFNSSYSASRAALIEAWKLFLEDRAWFARSWCQVIFEEWLTLEVIAGRIIAPGFLDSDDVRAAYLEAEWPGPAQGQIDPVKETDAAIMRIENGFSTHHRETAQMTGTDWSANMRRLQQEQAKKEAAGLVPDPVAPPDPEPPEPDAEDNQDQEESSDDAVEQKAA